MDPIELDGESLTPEGVAAVAREDADVSVTEAARDRVRTARERVESAVESGEAVYGLDTGFGELVDQRIPEDRIEALQTNLVRSHASGTGRELTREETRALMITRLNALLSGHSGVRERVIDHLVAMLDAGVHPVVRSRGSLGASGDLAPLAHVALVLIGEGEAYVDPGLVEEDVGTTTDVGGDTVDGDKTNVGDDANVGGDTNASSGDSDPASTGDRSRERERRGRRVDGETALAAAGLEPVSLAPKEGLALINGTQLTVGLAALAVVDAEQLCRAADAVGTLTTEVTMGTTAACDPAIHRARPHEGQLASAENVRRVAEGSEIVESHRNCDRVQDAYSIRCLPQVHGAVRDAVAHLREAVETELNAATDNPLVFAPGEVLDADRASGGEDAAVLSGGNFHGAPLAHRLDYLVGALTDLAAISERRVDRILNPNVQEGHLPPFLADDSGVESGLMIPQYTAAAMVNELRAEGRTATDTTPVSGNQEDHVSMSATGAFACRRAVDRTATAVGVELLCAGEALEYVAPDLSPGAGSGAVHDILREVVDPLDGDRPLHRDVDRTRDLVASGRLVDRVDGVIEDSLE